MSLLMATVFALLSVLLGLYIAAPRPPLLINPAGSVLLSQLYVSQDVSWLNVSALVSFPSLAVNHAIRHLNLLTLLLQHP